MKSLRLLICVVACLAVVAPALAQVPTGTLSGRVNDGTAPLPGVTVTVTSPNLQGARTAVTTVNGDYIFRFLPPGEYMVRFELSGFQTVEASMRIAAAQTHQLDAEMPMARLAEEITVTGSYETISSSSTASTTYDKEMIEQLPIGRDITAAVFLAPGVHNTGPSGNITISGGQSYENLWLVNGVVINENVRGQATGLFIEDAIQETTTTVSGVSAEYGRFAGGVVNMLTKSGGNQFSGSLRASLANDKWTSRTPLTVTRADELNKTYEATLGGFIVKDRLWFFLAGRDVETTAADQTRYTLIPFETGIEETRYEAKLTFAATAAHRLVGSYLERDRSWTNYWGAFAPLDMTQIYDRSIPEEFLALNYTGVISDKFFLEGQYSERKLTFVGSGSRFTGIYDGTVLRDWFGRGAGNAPWFCAVCPGAEEKRDNENFLAKAGYFLSSETWGTHDLVVGYDHFTDMIESNNWQTGSGYNIFFDNFVVDGQNWYPIITAPNTNNRIYWWPINDISQGTDVATSAIYLNDRWRLNNNWSFNLGLRYDKNDGTNSLGQVISKDSRVSPRFGVTYDPTGDGKWIFNASYSHYVQAIAGTGNTGNQSPAGNPSILGWLYFGPAINTGGAPYLTPRQVVEQMMDWFFSYYGGDPVNGPVASPNAQATFTGFNRKILGDLKSPMAEEIAVGFVRRLGTRGMFRFDYTKRDFKDGYEYVVTPETGTIDVIAFGRNWGRQDLGYVENSDYLERKYDGINLQAAYRLDKFDIGGNFTWSNARGNWDGETAGSGPISSSNNPRFYGEFYDVAWSNPRGRLGIDQRHKARAWVIWNFLNTRYHRASVSLLQNYFSGTFYSATGSVNRAWTGVANPGYLTPPASVTYYFSGRGAYQTDDVTRTDVSLNYSFLLPALGTNLEFFVQPRMTNVFNEKAVTAVNTTVSVIGQFNPFTETPVEGVHWRKGPDFGKPTATTSYQQPRTYGVSLGVRF